MSKLKFKVGDKVRVIDYRGRGIEILDKQQRIGQIYQIDSISGSRLFPYSLRGDCVNLYNESELELVERTYTGIELLQAINDKKVKHGDKFTMTYGNKNIPHHSDVYITKLGNIRIGTVENLNENLSVDIILSSTFTPIKAKPINHAEKEREYNTVASIKILDSTIYVPVRGVIKGNKVTAKLKGTHNNSIGVANCCPEDKFDKDKGIQIALLRAFRKFVVEDIDNQLRDLTN